MTTWATLGDIDIQVIKGPTDMGVKYSANYSVHGLIGRKGSLQHTGFNPDEINWTFQFHSDFCDPGEELRRLKEHFDARSVLPLVMGSGEYRGRFVIESIDVTLEHTGPDGTLIAIGFNMPLKEDIGDPAEPNPPGIIKSSAPAIEALTDPEVLFTEPPGGFMEMLDTALVAIDTIGEASARVNDIVATAQSGDLLNAVGLAGAYAPQLAEMAELLPVEDVSELQEMAIIANDAGSVATGLAQTRDSLNQAAGLLENASTLSALSSASGSVSSALTTAQATRPALARLEAYGAVGSRLGGLGGDL